MSSEANAYEVQRQQLIARNRARLEALGISSAATALQSRAAKPAPKPKKAKLKKAPVSHEPSRHSARLHPDAADGSEEASELALCIVNGMCPRCGKYVDVGHKKHLEHCLGSRKRKQGVTLGHVEIEGLDELEAEEEEQMQDNAVDADTKPAKKTKPARSQAEKLKELELSGLVDFDEHHARFAVIGSTGSHYNVELKDPAPTCQCVDYRIRKRICKHQKLVLLQLGIPDKPQDWHQAVSTKLDKLAQAEPAERESLLGETEYDPEYEERPAKQSKASKAVTNRGKSVRIAASRNAGKEQDDDVNDGDDNAQEGHPQKDKIDHSLDTSHQASNDTKDVKQESENSKGGLSPAGLAWPKRPPRRK